MCSRIVEGEVEKAMVDLTEAPEVGRAEQCSKLEKKLIWELG
jgi:hypothetical protein